MHECTGTGTSVCDETGESSLQAIRGLNEGAISMPSFVRCSSKVYPCDALVRMKKGAPWPATGREITLLKCFFRSKTWTKRQLSQKAHLACWENNAVFQDPNGSSRSDQLKLLS